MSSVLSGIIQRMSNRTNSNNNYSSNRSKIKTRDAIAKGKRHMGNICRQYPVVKLRKYQALPEHS